RSGVAQDWQMTEATLPPALRLDTGVETLIALRGGERYLAIPGAPRIDAQHVGVIVQATTGEVLHTLPLSGERFIAAAAQELSDGRLLVPVYDTTPLAPGVTETRGHLLVLDREGVELARYDVPFMGQAMHVIDGERRVVVLGDAEALAFELDGGAPGPWTLGGLTPALRTRGKVASAEGELNLFLNRMDAAGRRLMFVAPQGRLHVAESPWEAAPRALGLVEPEVRTVALSADGRLAAVANRSGEIRVWDLDGDALVMQVGESGRQWSALEFSPSGRLLSAGNRENRIRIWDVESGALLAVLEGHEHWVTRLAYLDEERLVSGSWDNTVRVWDLSTLLTPGEALVERAERETGLRLEGARVALIGAEE
ncbi:MAG: hypothetical protein H6741_34740, partial [Alphaproteobacteria bacterium]|nr:hypothetical protein [Alphaproteobacteria bacterium]